MRRALALIAALLSATVPTTMLAQIPTRAAALSLDHVGIQATDLDRSVAFYTKVLGLREVPAPFPSAAARWLALGSGRMLHIVAHGNPGSPHNRWDHFALACADLNAMMSRLDALHVSWADMDGHHVVQTRPDQVHQIFVRDPDGYVIEINDARIPN